MLKRTLLMAAIMSLLFGGVIGFKLYKRAAIQEYLANRDTVAVPLNATVTRADNWQQQLSAIGSLRAQHGIEIRAEADGVIRKLHVEPKQTVREGAILVEMDDTVDRATLKSALVRLEKARRDFSRDKALFERALISEDEFESSRSEFEGTQALVEETQGIIDKKTIRAPFTGTVGIHNLSEGHYLAKGDEVLTLQALEKLYLDINLPEKELDKLHPGQALTFTVPSHGARSFAGDVQFIDVKVQATTRNVLVRALVDNADRALLPGMFANITIILDEARDIITVPVRAVAYSLFGETVYQLSPEQGSDNWTAHRKAVKTLEIRDGMVAVEGLEPGIIIAQDTQHRLLEGTLVRIVNSDILSADSENPGQE